MLGVGLLVALGFLAALLIDSSGTSDTDLTEGSTGTTATAEGVGTPGTTDPPTDGEGETGTEGIVAVKVDNAPGARPQVGLANVPLLIEYPVEGGITRFVAVLDQSASGLLGPVRSLRPVDSDIVPLVAPILASTGGQPFVVQDVEATGVMMLLPGTSGVFDSLIRQPPHNVFLNLDSLMSSLRGQNPSIGAFPTGVAPSGTPAARIELPFVGTSFVWENDQYSRLLDGQPFEVFGAEGGPAITLTHDTIVVMYVAERSAGYTDSNDVEVSTFDLIGSGDLIVFHSGEAVEGVWLRRSHDTGYEFFDADRSPMGIPTGRTYVAFVPRDSEVSYR